MAWTIEFAASAAKALRDLDPNVGRRIVRFLQERVAPQEDPRALGQALKGSELGTLWKYRVGDYRIIVKIEDAAVRILVVRLGQRRDIYR